MNNLKIKEVQAILEDAKAILTEQHSEFYLTDNILNLLYEKNKNRFVQFFIELNELEKRQNEKRLSQLENADKFSTSLISKMMLKKQKWGDEEFFSLLYGVAPFFDGYKNNPSWYNSEEKLLSRIRSEFAVRDESFKDTVKKYAGEYFYSLIS